MDNRTNRRGAFQMDEIIPAYIASESVRVSCMRILKWGSDYPQFENDATKIASALLPYLDETPVDDGWIKAVGAEADFDSFLDQLFSFCWTQKREHQPREFPLVALSGHSVRF